MPRMSWIVLAGLLTACGGKHPGTYETAAADASGGSEVEALLSKADALWEERVDEAKLKEAIDLYQQAHEADGTNRHALVRLTRGWYFWGDAHTDVTDTKIERWGTAIEHGTRCIALNAKVASAINSGQKEKDAVAMATADDVPCLYWTASALGKWGKAQGIAKTLKHLPTVKAYISKVEELDPTFYNYGPARYWGAYYAALPSFAGQDLDKSAEYFEAAVEGAPYYLPTRLLRADMWAVATQDLAQFDKDLKYVIEADPYRNPDANVGPENVKDQAKARKLLSKRSELFEKKILEEVGEAPDVTPYEASSAERPDDADEEMEGASAERPEGEAPEGSETTEGASAERPDADEETEGASAERPEAEAPEGSETTEGAKAERPGETEGAGAERPDDEPSE